MVKGLSQDSALESNRLRTLPHPNSSSATSTKLLHISEPQFPHPLNGATSYNLRLRLNNVFPMERKQLS